VSPRELLADLEARLQERGEIGRACEIDALHAEKRRLSELANRAWDAAFAAQDAGQTDAARMRRAAETAQRDFESFSEPLRQYCEAGLDEWHRIEEVWELFDSQGGDSPETGPADDPVPDALPHDGQIPSSNSSDAPYGSLAWALVPAGLVSLGLLSTRSSLRAIGELYVGLWCAQILFGVGAALRSTWLGSGIAKVILGFGPWFARFTVAGRSVTVGVIPIGAVVEERVPLTINSAPLPTLLRWWGLSALDPVVAGSVAVAILGWAEAWRFAAGFPSATWKVLACPLSSLIATVVGIGALPLHSVVAYCLLLHVVLGLAVLIPQWLRIALVACLGRRPEPSGGVGVFGAAYFAVVCALGLAGLWTAGRLVLALALWAFGRIG
jgi:hypothetical protein